MMNPQLIVRRLALSLWVTVLVFPTSGFVPFELRMCSPIPTFRTLYGAGKDNTVRPAMTSTRNSAALLPTWLIERLFVGIVCKLSRNGVYSLWAHVHVNLDGLWVGRF